MSVSESVEYQSSKKITSETVDFDDNSNDVLGDGETKVADKREVQIHANDHSQLLNSDQDYNSTSDVDYVESYLSSGSDESEEYLDMRTNEVEDELCFLEEENYLDAVTTKISKIVEALNTIKSNQQNLAKLWEAMDQNKVLIKVSKNLFKN